MKWSQKTVVEQLLHLENKYYLLSGGDHKKNIIWERIRFHVYRKIMTELEIEKSPVIKHSLKKLNFFSRIKIILRIINYSIKKNPFRFKQKEKILFYCNQKRRLNDGFYTDIWSDPIIDLIGNDNVISIENPDNYFHFSPQKLKNVYYMDYILVIGEIFCKIISFFFRENKNIFLCVENDINKTFSTNIDLSGIVKNTIVKRNIYVKLYKALLKYYKPKAVFVICSYIREDIIEAAKSLKIKTIELQHGVITPWHLGYSFPDQRKKETFPDYFLSYGQFWNNNVEMPIKKENVRIVGFQYLNSKLIELKNVKKDKTVLVLSQGNIGHQLSNFILKLIDIFEDFHFIYKLHPGEYSEWENLYPELYQASLQEKIQVNLGDNKSIHELLSEAQWQIGVNSTALFEGLAFNCRTIILNMSGHEYLHDLVEKKVVKLFDINDKLDRTFFEFENSSIVINDLFDKKSKENAKQTIIKILEE